MRKRMVFVLPLCRSAGVRSSVMITANNYRAFSVAKYEEHCHKFGLINNDHESMSNMWMQEGINLY